jgi:hypothetical protein
MMKRFGLAVVVTAVAATPAAARDRNAGGIPELDYVSTCKATPPVAMDREAQLKSCLNDEKQAKADLPKQWQRSKAEWRSSCLRQTTLGGLASYVELITCLEMHDPNPPSLNRPGVTAPAAAAAATPGATPPATATPGAGIKPDIGSPLQRGVVPR